MVGSSTALSGDDHAFIIPFGSQLGPVWDLGTLGAYSSTAYSLNQYGQVVGTSLRYFGEDPQSRAFICRHGIAMQDLNDLVYNLGDWRLRSATGISDEGYICGWGYKGASSTPRAFVLSPY